MKKPKKNLFDDDDKALLLQFVANAEEAGVLWQAGKLSGDPSAQGLGPTYVVKVLVGTTLCEGRHQRLHTAIKECVSAALPTGNFTLKG